MAIYGVEAILFQNIRYAAGKSFILPGYSIVLGEVMPDIARPEGCLRNHARDIRFQVVLASLPFGSELIRRLQEQVHHVGPIHVAKAHHSANLVSQ
ncbi:hypothetical protein FQZ97_407210 [compost metagenome]